MNNNSGAGRQVRREQQGRRRARVPRQRAALHGFRQHRLGPQGGPVRDPAYGVQRPPTRRPGSRSRTTWWSRRTASASSPARPSAATSRSARTPTSRRPATRSPVTSRASKALTLFIDNGTDGGRRSRHVEHAPGVRLRRDAERRHRGVAEHRTRSRSAATTITGDVEVSSTAAGTSWSATRRPAPTALPTPSGDGHSAKFEDNSTDVELMIRGNTFEGGDLTVDRQPGHRRTSSSRTTPAATCSSATATDSRSRARRTRVRHGRRSVRRDLISA